MVIRGAEFLGVASYLFVQSPSQSSIWIHVLRCPKNSGTALQSMGCDLQDGDVETLMEMKLSSSKSASHEVDV